MVEVFGVFVPTWIILLLLAALLVYIYGTWTYDYFSKLGIPGPKPWPCLGCFPEIFIQGMNKYDLNMIKQHGKIVGLYELRSPILMVADPALLKQIMVKEFSHFTNRRFFPGVLQPPFDKMLSALRDDDWRRVRSLVTPAFSSGKLKAMAGQINHCADVLVECINEAAEKGDIDVKQLTTGFTLDVIARAGFATDTNCQKNQNDPFLKHANKLTNLNPIAIMTMVLAPKLISILRKLHIQVGFPDDSLDFFRRLVVKFVEEQKDEDKKSVNLLSLMMRAHKDAVTQADTTEDKDIGFSFDASAMKKHKGMTKDELTGGSAQLIVAGTETTASTLNFLIYSLAVHPEIQEKVIQEIDENIGKDSFVTWEHLQRLTYLDQCIQETLRKFPPVLRVDRECSSDVTINGVPFKKGMPVMIAINAVNNNPDLWPEPEKFDPDRFSPDKKTDMDPLMWIPFGFGPRNCIGMRLAQMELKIATVKILQKMRFKACDKTQIPLVMKKSILLQPASPVLIHVEQRN